MPSILGDITEHEGREGLRRRVCDASLALFDAFPNPVWRSRLDGTCDYVNRAWLEFRGRTLAQERENGWVEGVHPEDREHCLRTYRDAVELRREFQVEYRLRRADGQYRWFVDYGRPVEAGDGEFAGYVGSCYDVTERKAAEEALRVRTSHLDAVRAVSEEITRELDLNRLLLLLIARAGELVGAWGGTVYLWEPKEGAARAAAWSGGGTWRANLRQRLGEGTAGAVAQTRRSLLVNEFRSSPYITAEVREHAPEVTATLGEPLLYREELIGIIVLAHEGGRGFTPEDQEVLRLFAIQAAIAIKNARLYGEGQRELAQRREAERALVESQGRFRALAAHVEHVREEERTRIARQVHDELGQGLACIKMDLAWLASQVPPERTEWHDKLTATTRLADETILTVRQIASELRPAVLDSLGLVAAIQWQAHEFRKRTGLRCRASCSVDEARVNGELATTTFRVLQEALNNIALHAAAQTVSISMEDSEETLILRIQDDGRGITQAEIDRDRSFGLIGMRERAELLGGTVTIRQPSGGGTEVVMALPLSLPGETE